MIPILADIVYLSQLFGIPLSTVAGFSATMLGCVGASCYSAYKETKSRMINKEYEEVQEKKKQIEVDYFNEERERDNKQVIQDHEDMQIKKKERDIKNYRLVECTDTHKIMYKGIRPPNKHCILLGYDGFGLPTWGEDTNYIFSGETGCGKTRKAYVALLNWLANKQGNVYMADLKGTDFKMFKNCKDVKCYVDDINNCMQPVAGFMAEYNYRVDLFNKGNYIDLDDYNSKNENKLREFLLLIDEYADISDIYVDNNKRPIGTYAQIIYLARKCRSFGGRIILGTQRPSVDVICGTLKANCTVVGMRCINALNSNIMIGCEGCERLEKREALSVVNGELKKIFSYAITNKLLLECTSKL